MEKLVWKMSFLVWYSGIWTVRISSKLWILLEFFLLIFQEILKILKSILEGIEDPRFHISYLKIAICRQTFPRTIFMDLKCLKNRFYGWTIWFLLDTDFFLPIAWSIKFMVLEHSINFWFDMIFMKSIDCSGKSIFIWWDFKF
jgi:hypothetical protein